MILIWGACRQVYEMGYKKLQMFAGSSFFFVMYFFKIVLIQEIIGKRTYYAAFMFWSRQNIIKTHTK